MKPLNVLEIPLQGRRLIEASAGTGKTYTITTLFLRLLLERHLRIDQILVVTFTRAATAELRARVRARSFDEFDGWVRHDGEEFLYVLTGAIRLLTEFYEPVEMRRGDSAYYDASMGHNVISVSDEDATILWVTSL